MSGMVSQIRDPASALTHGIWFLAAIPLLWRLINRTENAAKKVTFSIYGATLLICAAGSTLFHTVQGSAERIEWYNRLDHLGIGLLIAGTFTPIARHLLEPTSGRRTLKMIWSAAILASIMRMTVDEIPKSIAIIIYLVMGWSAIPGYYSLCKQYGWNKARMIAEGGFFYTVGALIHWQNRPDFIPGIFMAHDLFHVFVMLGSYRHYQFMVEAVLPNSLGETLISPSAKPEILIMPGGLAMAQRHHLIRKPYILKKLRERQIRRDQQIRS